MLARRDGGEGVDALGRLRRAGTIRPAGPPRWRLRARTLRYEPVVGVQLRLEVEIVRISRAMGKYTARATVDGAVAAEAQLMCALRQIGSGAPDAGASGAGEPA